MFNSCFGLVLVFLFCFFIKLHDHAVIVLGHESAYFSGQSTNFIDRFFINIEQSRMDQLVANKFYAACFDSIGVQINNPIVEYAQTIISGFAGRSLNFDLPPTTSNFDPFCSYPVFHGVPYLDTENRTTAVLSNQKRPLQNSPQVKMREDTIMELPKILAPVSIWEQVFMLSFTSVSGCCG